MNGTVNSSIAQPPQYLFPSETKLLSWAFSYYRSRFALIFGISLIPFLLGMVQVFVRQSVPILFVVIAVITAVVAYISRLALIAAVAGESQTVGGAYSKGVRLLIPFIWINVLVTLTTLGGTFLLFIPGLLLSIWLSFSAYILFAENRRGISAMTQSWHYVKGYLLSVFWRFLFFGIVLLIIVFVIQFATTGLTIFQEIKSSAVTKPPVPLFARLIDLFFFNLMAIPLGIIYSFGIYSALRQIKEAASAEADEQKLRKNIKIFAVIGTIGLIAIIIFAGFFAR